VRRAFTILLSTWFLAQTVPAEERGVEPWQKVVLTEVMVAPIGMDPAAAGQWIEVRNPSEDPVNLQGLVLANLQGGFHVISPTKPLVIEPGGFRVLARFSGSLKTDGIPVDYEYGADFWMDLESDVLLLRKGDRVVDLFAYGPEQLPVKPGAAFSLQGSGMDAAKEWCYARGAYDPRGNLGTPGAVNPDCDGDLDGWAEDQGDCDDHDPAVHPGAAEICNGLDDDCNGLVDDGLAAAPPCLALGVCAGVQPVCEGAKGWACKYPGSYEPEEVSCDGLDNDCDGLTDEGLAPPEPCLALGVCAGVQPVCAGPDGWVCGYPAAYEPEEVSCDGLDNDCDGETDEGFPVEQPCTVGLGVCARTGVFACAEDRSSVVCTAEPAPPTPERCGDGLDNDCDGETDEGFPVGQTCVVGVGACQSVGKYRCAEDAMSVICNAVPADPVPERCGNGVDDDCDGETDEPDCESAGAGAGCHASSRPGAWPFLLLWIAAVRSARRVRRALTGPAGCDRDARAPRTSGA